MSDLISWLTSSPSDSSKYGRSHNVHYVSNNKPSSLIMMSARPLTTSEFDPLPSVVKDISDDIRSRLGFRRDFGLVDECSFGDIPSLDPYDALPAFLAFVHAISNDLIDCRLVSFGRYPIAADFRRQLLSVHEKYNVSESGIIIDGGQRSKLQAVYEPWHQEHMQVHDQNTIAPVFRKYIINAKSQ